MSFFSGVPRYVRDLAGVPQPGARVDPAQLPEADYPVYCMRCGYELRGLTEPRCPECGEAFDRGQLLVEQYVRLRRPLSDRRQRLGRRVGRLGWWLLAGMLVGDLCFLVPFKIWPAATLEFVTRSNTPLFAVFAAFVGIRLLAVTCLLLSVVLQLSGLPAREKRRAVRAAWRAGRGRAQK